MIRMRDMMTETSGIKKSTWDQLKTNFDERIGLTSTIKRESHMNRRGLKQLVKEEYVKIQKEAQEAAPKIEKKLHECREKMVAEFCKREQMGTSFQPAMEKRLQIHTVAEMIDVPVNELVLYFLNNVKTMNERSLVEYHSGQVYFYAN